ncbi:formate/nitrite transporter family protein [Tropicimonas sp. TH_r6]|uniref:formate/nitrite transporter family protein n=1 Tax=Tropicimonas sp. TH_r6 TaxID=3082085 RepID=UPI002954EDFF|nr:formate/nitrite transporter family protein [Tropicimonas sp. TH_r6]MDV7145872.1 formate/nitrite transporter family protein [Tropicimonas sp. TH_r6]
MSKQLDQLFPGTFFISTVLEALDAKTRMSGEVLRKYLMRASMAGILIGLLYATNYALVAAFDAIGFAGTTLAPLGKIAGAFSFGGALVFIYFTKSELLTSNMMIVSIGVYYRRIRPAQGGRLLFHCYLGNLIGGFAIAIPLCFSTVIDGAPLDQMLHAVDVKLAFLTSGPAGLADLFWRAVLCNFMINVAMLLVFNGFVKEDLTKSLAMILAVFIFVFLGFEHSVANTILFAIVGLKEGIDLGLAVGNVAIALVGNFVGGGILIGLYYAYVNDASGYLRKHPEAADDEAPATHSSR